MRSSAVRPLAGLGLFVAIALVIALAVALFRGSFTPTEPVTVISDRAGLVMNNDADVKMRGVQVGTVDSIESRPDGTAALHLAMDPKQLHLIPKNVLVDIASTTVFGAKFVQLIPPDDPSPETLQPGQVIQGRHVMVEINTVFQQLVQVLDKIDPAKLNQTLGAIATAFNGRGEKIGQTLTDLNAFLAEIEPSLPNLSHDIETSVPVLTAYADAAPDLITTIDSSTRISNSIVEEQQNLDEFLVS
ncbi:MAG: MCE family protein, partial [Mycobacterium sp.]